MKWHGSRDDFWVSLCGAFIGLSLGLMAIIATPFVNNVFAQERNLRDRPKDSQELCGYTLKPDQVKRFSNNNSYLMLDIDSQPSADVVESIEKGPVCAFRVDNPDLTDVTVVQVYWRQSNTFSGSATGVPQFGDHIFGVSLKHRKNDSGSPCNQ